jgi:hypothetical protein
MAYTWTCGFPFTEDAMLKDNSEMDCPSKRRPTYTHNVTMAVLSDKFLLFFMVLQGMIGTK